MIWPAGIGKSQPTTVKLRNMAFRCATTQSSSTVNGAGGRAVKFDAGRKLSSISKISADDWSHTKAPKKEEDMEKASG